MMILLFIFSSGCSQTRTNQGPVLPNGQSTSAVADNADQNQVTLTPAITPIFTPTVAKTLVQLLVPYTKTSIWNTPIGSSPRYDPHSAEMITNLVFAHDGKIITPGTFNYPVYFADANTPRWNIPCKIYKCTVASPNGEVIRTDMVEDVPILPDAQPAPDTDGRMIIIDTVTFAEYDLWRAERVETGWSAGNVSVYSILWDGTPTRHSSRGAGVPSYAGLVRPWEIQQGRIEHVLAFGYTEPAEGKCVFPASKTDGVSRLPFAIPEGAHLQLDPSLTEKDFEQMGLDRTGRIIARALQEYGMILVDHSGSFKIYLEDLANNPYAKQKWTDPELNLSTETLSSIPYTSFRVLELPPGYWGSSENTVYHGKCLTFSGIP